MKSQTPEDAGKLIRKTWPKIRIIYRRGKRLYQVDARRKGTNGKQEAFDTQAAAEKEAARKEESFNGNGTEGLAMSAELRVAALKGEAMLAPFGKTVFQACEFFRDLMQAEQAKEKSALVKILADEWLEDKKSNSRKTLRKATIDGIRQATLDLKEAFGEMRVLAVMEKDVEAFIDGKKVGRWRKIGMRSYFSQFFNWAIDNGYAVRNPAAKMEIEAEERDVEIFAPETALHIMRVCEEKYPDFVLYYALSLFAGLRPEECKLLKWEQIHLADKQITVLGETSKHKDTRPVAINDTLKTWFDEYAPAADERKGFVTRQKNFSNRAKLVRSGLGFRHFKMNKEATVYPQDAPRHSFASHWLPVHKNRAELAELMGNSVDVIKKHYRKVVPMADCVAYWEITPKNVQSKSKAKKMKGKQTLDAIMETLPSL